MAKKFNEKKEHMTMWKKDIENMKENMKDVLAVLSIILGIILLCSLPFLCKRVTCLKSYENFHPKWGLISGCRIEVNDVLTPVSIVRELK